MPIPTGWTPILLMSAFTTTHTQMCAHTRPLTCIGARLSAGKQHSQFLSQAPEPGPQERRALPGSEGLLDDFRLEDAHSTGAIGLCAESTADPDREGGNPGKSGRLLKGGVSFFFF